MSICLIFQCETQRYKSYVYLLHVDNILVKRSTNMKALSFRLMFRSAKNEQTQLNTHMQRFNLTGDRAAMRQHINKTQVEREIAVIERTRNHPSTS